MTITERKVYSALEGSGHMYNVEEWLSEGLRIDTYARRYGWNFVKDVFGFETLDIEQFAVLRGIILGENKKSRMDTLREKARLKGM